MVRGKERTRKLRRACRSLFPLALLAALPAIPADGLAQETTAITPVKNVIVMIGDGAGYNHFAAGSIYRHGAPNAESFDSWPVKLAMATFSAGGESYEDTYVCPPRSKRGNYNPERAWSDFDYVKHGATDSAAAATAMSAGIRTYNNAIGVDCLQAPRKHASEDFEDVGRSTGVVTSVEWSHATPAGNVAHNARRDDRVAIAKEMVLDSATDVIMGAGHPDFRPNGTLKPLPIAERAYEVVGGSQTWAALHPAPDSGIAPAGGDADGDGDADPWTTVESKAAFEALTSGPTPARVLGTAPVNDTLQQARAQGAPPNTTVPTLATMARGALNVLDEDPDGFYLMIEGGAIDLASHAAWRPFQIPRIVEEQVAFHEAIDAVSAWVESNSSWEETMVIITADHETGYLTGPGSGTIDGEPVWTDLENRGAGVLPGMQLNHFVASMGNYQHTNSLVPFYAKGGPAEAFTTRVVGTDPVRGPYIENRSISDLLFEILRAG